MRKQFVLVHSQTPLLMMTQSICHSVKLEMWVCLGIQLYYMKKTPMMMQKTYMMSPLMRNLISSP